MTELPARVGAVVLSEFNAPLKPESALVREPGPGAVVAQVDLAGVCGRDVQLHDGFLPIPIPIALGHEGVGHVWRLGQGASTDYSGNSLREGTGSPELPTHHVGNGIGESSPASAPLLCAEQGIALGCAAPTAVHGMIDVAGITVGDSVEVQGSGPVGMASAMYAHLAGASRVILVGGPSGCLLLAREIGVGDVRIDIFEFPESEEWVRRVLDAAPGRRGADVVLECAGVPEAVVEGAEMTRPGGTFLALGQYTDRREVPLNRHLITQKQLRIVRSWGFAEKHYLGHIEALTRLNARFYLQRLITHYPLEDADRALADMGSGRVMKPVLDVRSRSRVEFPH